MNDTNSAHTPGPWTAEFDEASMWVTPPNRSEAVICDLQPRDADAFTDEDEANAHLIAAAPDLYEALKLAQLWLANCIPTTEIEGPKPLPIIVAALAKAEGR